MESEVKTVCDNVLKNVNNIDSNKQNFGKKIEDGDKKIPDTSN